MSFLTRTKNKYKIIAAIDPDLVATLVKQLQTIEHNKQQEYLNKYVVDEGIGGNDLLELMYDLGKEGFTVLKKPTIQGVPKPKSKRKQYFFKGREIVDIEFANVSDRYAPRYEDAYIQRAVYDDTGEELNDAEMNELNDDSQYVSELLYDYIH